VKHTQRQWDRDVGIGSVPDKYKYNCPKCEDTGVIPFHKLTPENKKIVQKTIANNEKTKLLKCEDCVEN
tara:strand:+ start:329 stop:535 length:207 start_codon:yes stop_codon:yes gene_type:complete